MTLDAGTSRALARRAKLEGKPRAALVRELLKEAIRRREMLDEQRKLARDYAAGRPDALALLAEMELAQTDLLDDAP